MSNEFPPRKGSLVWDDAGHFRALEWSRFRDEVRDTPGGLSVAAADFQELLEYRPAPNRDKTWTLRQAATELLAGATADDDFRFLAKICAILVQHDRYLEACWLLVRMRDSAEKLNADRVAHVLNHLYVEARTQLKLVLMGLQGFVESHEPLVKTLDTVLASGLLRREVLTMMKSPSVFISYAKEDRPRADRLYETLTRYGFSVWLDSERLVPGDDWEPEIERAIETSDFAVPCLSTTSVQKVGFFQAELRRLMKRQEHHPSGTAFVIPVRLDKCEVPREFRRYQWLDLFPDFDQGLERLGEAIRAQWGKRHDA